MGNASAAAKKHVPDVPMNVQGCTSQGYAIQKNRQYLQLFLTEMEQLSTRVTHLEEVLREHEVDGSLDMRSLHRLEEKMRDDDGNG